MPRLTKFILNGKDFTFQSSFDLLDKLSSMNFSTKGIGRGLGTYSMKLLSERYLNGKVDFVSSPEHGTTFFARYPTI